jgi:hypothetical protein
VRTVTRQLDDITFRCILMRHAMEELPASVRYERGAGTRITFRCLRGCGTERVDWTDRNGDLVDRKYHHTDHYKAALRAMQEGKGRPPINKMRLELIQRARSQQKRRTPHLRSVG